MLFSSPTFLFLFLPLVLLFYYSVFRKFPNLVLVIASLVFYWWGEPEFIYILLTAILLNYFFGLMIQNSHPHLRMFFLHWSIILNLGLLIYYKYWSFPVVISTPLAISFFTFHAISYNADIFRKQASAQKNPFRLLLYFLFFPHLLAGPIIRYHTIVEQLKKRTIYFDDFIYGIERFVFGLAKKVLIADKLSPVVNEIFSIPTDHIGTPVAWVGIISFTLQIYFDFSGYSDMAIGLARMFGFTFPENFNYPYISTSITEFWRRWHITLSNWFRDYVYIPLGGNRTYALKRYFNFWTVFILVGIWHGASWTFIVWGIIQAIALSLERIKNGILFTNLWSPFKHIYALFVIMIGWVFFRAENLSYALSYLQVLFGIKNHGIIFQPVKYFLQPDIILVILIGLICSTPISLYFKKMVFNSRTGFAFVRFIYLTVLLFLIAIGVASQTYNPFLYFRF